MDLFGDDMIRLLGEGKGDLSARRKEKVICLLGGRVIRLLEGRKVVIRLLEGRKGVICLLGERKGVVGR